ncbi:MAG: ankyrin repeat domain-containing protein [Candidatus Sulfopaludibacter sp.]|nr:ankyrin repeat domain-containing protein [Candidatus Sulfopaludibacter sp.]
MSRELPSKPNLEFLRKQAKELLRDLQRENASTKLSDAQHTLARDYGFATWPKLKEYVEELAHVLSPAEMLAAAVRASDAARAGRVLAGHPELKAQINEPMAGYGAGMQAILAAVQRTDRAMIDVLLAAGADINARSHWWAGGMGVLDECLPELAPFLMARGAVANAHSAARLGMFPKLQELVRADPGVVAVHGVNGQMPLHCASTVEIAKYLLDQGADMDARDLLHQSTPAQHMVRVVQARHYPRDRQDIARLLVARGCRTDILMAAALGDLDLVRRHLDADPDSIRTCVSEAYFPKEDSRSEGTIYVQAFGPERTPHLVARDFGHEEVFRYLMARSPEDVKLAQACDLGDADLFRALLASRPNLVATLSDDGWRRLPNAAQNNNTAAVSLMLSGGWPVDVPGEYGLTALQWASWHGNAEMVREVLRYRPQLELKDNEHRISALGSALHGSENSWHRDTGDYADTVRALLEAGATAPKLTSDLEASEEVREVLREYEERAG